MNKGDVVTVKPFDFTVQSVVNDILEPKLSTPFVTGFITTNEGKKCYVSIPVSCIDGFKK